MSQDPNIIVQNQNQTTTTTDSNTATDTTQTTAAITDTPVVDSSISTTDSNTATDTTAQTTAVVTDTPVADSNASTTNSNTPSNTTDQGYLQGEAILKQQPSKVITNGIFGFQIEKVEIEINVNNYFGDMEWQIRLNKNNELNNHKAKKLYGYQLLNYFFIVIYSIYESLYFRRLIIGESKCLLELFYQLFY